MAEKIKDKENKETVKKGDFVELEFIGKVKDGEIFDTNIKSEAEKIGLNLNENEEGKEKPFIICVGYDMVIHGLDKALEGKQIDEQYEIEILPEDAFGMRNASLVKTIPTKVFLEKNIKPEKGMVFAFDNMLVRVIAISGGRVTTDFNNPLAGKILVYRFKIKRKIENEKEKINALMEYFFKNEFEFEIEENKIKITAEKQFEERIKMFSGKFKEMLGKEVVFEEKEKGENKSEKAENEEKAAKATLKEEKMTDD